MKIGSNKFTIDKFIGSTIIQSLVLWLEIKGEKLAVEDLLQIASASSSSTYLKSALAFVAGAEARYAKMSKEKKEHLDTFGFASHFARIKHDLVRKHNKLITSKQDEVWEGYQVHPYLVDEHTLGRSKNQPKLLKKVLSTMDLYENGFRVKPSFQTNTQIKKSKCQLKMKNLNSICTPNMANQFFFQVQYA